MQTSLNNSVYSFRAPSGLYTATGVSVATLLFCSLFFLNVDVAFAQEVSAPSWLDEEYMEAEVVESEHKEASLTPSTSGTSAYTRTFIISAYYSPIPGQQRYVTGSYAGDIRLNGSGVNGADGTPVYPGMIAAPKTYAFGTKMKIPGVGTVAVHDRGGAIVNSGQRGNAHDRLDVWMGYGDVGLQRALNWGKRTVDVEVYGIDPSIQEHVILEGYSESEKHVVPDSLNAPAEPTVNTSPQVQPAAPTAPQVQLFAQQLSYGESGGDVAKLQELLRNLEYYQGEITSTFDKATYEAVHAFQVDEGIIPRAGAYGAGYVGPRTMSVLAAKEITPAAHAKTETIETISTFATDLKLGDSGEDVRKLQAELKRINLLGIEPTGYYGEVTEHAVFKFQQVHKLAGDKSSTGAGIFGPMTRAKFNTIVAARLETERGRAVRVN